jgi:hypothetical protein
MPTQPTTRFSTCSLVSDRPAVKTGADLERVLALPRREPATEELIDLLSKHLRKRENNREGQENRLRPAQVEALRELWEMRGLFAPMKVGAGKTLPTLLAATLLDAQRPVLLIPASLREKTLKDYAAYHEDWHVRLPILVSYEEMGRPDRESRLIELAPDLLILDEAHKARNLDAAVTRRVRRCIEALNPVVACLSGTLLTEQLLDYHHHAVWSLGEKAPLPLRPADAERWAAALDRNVGLLKRHDLGALESIPGGFHEFFRGSRGVVPTPGSDCTASIQISIWRPKVPPRLAEILRQVECSSMRPDGELLDEFELPDCLGQLSLGFYYRWDPEPPTWWLKPRRSWNAYVRDVLDQHLEGFDSTSQIVQALDLEPRRATQHNAPQRAASQRNEVARHTPGLPPAAEEGRHLLAAWRAVRDNFVPNPIPVWLDASIMAQAVEDTERGTIIWTDYRAPGHLLEKLGVPYYGGGTDPQSAPVGQTIACSIKAHGTGRNLQARNRSLVLTIPGNSDAWEQLIGRTHRPGQKSDTVYIDVIGSIERHGAVLGRVLAQAKAFSKASGFSHKLVDADWL